VAVAPGQAESLLLVALQEQLFVSSEGVRHTRKKKRERERAKRNKQEK
jgi:hypothetical protein